MRVPEALSRLSVACLAATLAAPAPYAVARAQESPSVPIRGIGPVDVEFAQPFAGIGALRELPDGRVIVADQRERALEFGDFRAIRGQGATPGTCGR